MKRTTKFDGFADLVAGNQPTRRKDPDKMNVNELFGQCPDHEHVDLRNGQCPVCGWAPTVSQVEARRQWLKQHPEER